ncbi:unnamed protein product [Linum trigynum]|uniref:SWIM-type domain-containing protein n=1 Tax=Linum trigynum TaxID=586398 RepID=A0AAV2ECH1_9ROSI
MITGFTYQLPEWKNGVLIHHAVPIVDDDSLNVLFDFMAQNPCCLGAAVHAWISQGENETWSMPSDHEYDDEEEEEEEDEEEEEEEPNGPRDYFLQGNEEDDELSYVDSYNIIPMPIVADFEVEFYKGQIYYSKQAAHMAIKYHAQERNFQYVVVESLPSIWKVKCLKHKDENCAWMVRFGCQDVGSEWIVRKSNLMHSCSSTTQPTDRRHLDVDVISESVKHLVRAQPNLSVLTMQAELKDKFHMEVTYKKAWYEKQKALEKLHGNWEESYDYLQTFLQVVKRKMPTSVIDWVRIPSSQLGHMIFLRVFWAFGPCIDGFKNCPGVMVVDGTFLTGKYKGVLLMACSFDGRKKIFPIAFAIVESENTDSWSWFIRRLQDLTDRNDVCIISNRHARLCEDMSDIGRAWEWRWCMRHYASNLQRKTKSKIMYNQLVRVAKEKRLEKFDRQVEQFKKMAVDRNVACSNWVDQNQIRWSLACDNHNGGRRWSIMTSNMSESINSVFKGIRSLPVASLVQHTYWRLLEKFDKMRLETEAEIRSGHSQYTKTCEDLIKGWAQKAVGHSVTGVDRRQGIYVVRTPPNNSNMTGSNILTVHFDNNNRVGFCTCGKFQGHKIPCSHAIAVCNRMGVNPYRFVNDIYKLERVLACYGTSFTPLDEPKGWKKHNGSTLHPNVYMIRNPGRPRSTRIHNEMDCPREGVAQQVCRNCNQSGHNASTCGGQPSGSGSQRRGSGGQ